MTLSVYPAAVSPSSRTLRENAPRGFSRRAEPTINHGIRSPPAALAGTQSFLTRVFGWMVVGLLVTAASAAVIGSSDWMLADVTSNPILLIVLFVAQLGLVVAISAGVNRMSTGDGGRAVPASTRR